MAKEDILELDGLVTESLPESRFRVMLDNGRELLAYTAGRLKKHRIRVLVGDRVTVELSPYDLDKGRINYRHKAENAPRRTGGQRRPPRRR